MNLPQPKLRRLRPSRRRPNSAVKHGVTSMALPPLIKNTYPERQRRFYDAYKAGARDALQHLAPRNDKCDMCHRVESRGLHLFRCPDGTTYKLGPDCREAY